MKRLLIVLLALGMIAVSAQAEDDEVPMPMRGMYMQDGMGMMGMQRQMRQNNMRHPDCGHGYGMTGDGMGMMHPGMTGGMGMMGGGMGSPMMGMGGGMMVDPETQREMMQSMMEFQQKMMQQRMEFQQKMRRQMMSQPRVITNMLERLLENPDAVEKTLDANPELKARLKKVL